jgi:hypothetical protein
MHRKVTGDFIRRASKREHFDAQDPPQLVAETVGPTSLELAAMPADFA